MQRLGIDLPMSALTFLIVAVIKIAVTIGVLLTVVAYTVWLERKAGGPYAESLGTFARRSLRIAAASR